MTAFDVVAALVTMAAVFAWVNHRYIRLPTTIGLLVISLVLSLVLVVLEGTGVLHVNGLVSLVEGIDFDQAVLHGMLGALLFAGALHVELGDLLSQKVPIVTLATVGVVTSTTVVGLLAMPLFGWLGFTVPLAYTLLFGAIVSPTDPIAVAAILKSVGVPRSVMAKISGESLFNDGLGVVVFLLLAGIASGAEEASVAMALELFMVEVVGGLVFGGALGWLAYHMLKRVDSYSVEILITLAVVTGGYALANHLHLSGPLAMVVAGLLLGNRGRALAMSETTRERLDKFWELVDEFLNAVLFVLIGIEVVAVAFDVRALLAGALAVPVVLVARWVSVGLPVMLMRTRRTFTPHVVKVLTWSGLKGGISVALALSLPLGPHRELIVTATYVVVCFSIVVQGLTVGAVVRRLLGPAEAEAGPAGH
ncbi:MAG: sodium:proton antiporter [Gemmatimonadota bacterium]|jgi:CPA1 family monovalent cation:H+ antiporter